MEDHISFGKRKISISNYSRFVVVPKQLLENLGVDADDYLEFLIRKGVCVIRPHKAEHIIESDEVKKESG